MEIERKFTIKRIPDDLGQYKCYEIEQGYLNRKPVLRIRKRNDEYILTYKMKQKSGENGPIVNIEEEFPLNEEAYLHLREKCDGNIIKKKRYLIPLDDGLTAELDIFEGCLSGLIFAEVEFPDEERADSFVAPPWFDKDVTSDKRYSNGHLSQINMFT